MATFEFTAGGVAIPEPNDAGPYWGNYTIANSNLSPNARIVLTCDRGHQYTDWVPRGNGCPVCNPAPAAEPASSEPPATDAHTSP